MPFTLNMWNFHSWFRTHGIQHAFSISEAQDTIRGVRFQPQSPQEFDSGYALIAKTAPGSEYRSVLSYGEDRIYFHTLSIFEAMDAIQYMLTIYSHWEQSLKKINLAHGKLENLLALCYELMPYPIFVFHGGQLLASAPRFETEITDIFAVYQHCSLSALLACLKTDCAGASPSLPGTPVLHNSCLLDGRQVILSSLLDADGQCIRIAAVANGAPLTSGDVRFVQLLADAIHRNLSLQKQRNRQNPFSYFPALIRGEDIPAPEPALRRLLWDGAAPYAVCFIELRSGKSSLALDKLYALIRERLPQAYPLQYYNAVVLFFNLKALDFLPDEAYFQDFLPCEYFVCGMSNRGESVSVLPQLVWQARSAMEQARQKNCFFLSADAIMSDYIYQAMHEDETLQTLVHPAVRFLAGIEKTNHYLDTLRAFLINGGNYAAAAAQLNLHRSSLVNRIDRICTVTGLSLDNAGTREALFLSLLILQPDAEGCEPQISKRLLHGLGSKKAAHQAAPFVPRF